MYEIYYVINLCQKKIPITFSQGCTTIVMDPIDKEELTMLFPWWRITSPQTGQAQNIPKGFIPKMKSDSHVCNTKVYCECVFDIIIL